MNHALCMNCQVRFPPSEASYLTACPTCGTALTPLERSAALGYRLFKMDDVSMAAPTAIEVSMPVPDPGSAS